MRSPDDRVLACVGSAVCELFEALPGVQFWVKDRAGRYCLVNRGFLMNYALERREQVVGKTDHDLSPPHLADQYLTDDERVLAGEVVENRLELVGRFDHTAVWSQTTKRPIRDAQGEIIGSVGLTRVADSRVVQSERPEAALGRVLAHMRAHLAEPLSNSDLARIACLSVRAFERAFRKQLHLTPQHYLRRLRVRLACHALVRGDDAMLDVALAHGFYDQSHFVREFRRETGLTPGQYRKQFAASS
ncbi:MAG TPA: helix-turn-helix domain-containing protein [Pirellulales bacterium]